MTKAVADGVRVYAAVTTNLAEEARRRHGLYHLAAAALGRTMTGALLLAANLKNDEALTVKIRGDGILGGVTADASASGYVRGYVDNPKAVLPTKNGKLDVGGGIGASGTIAVTRFTGLKEPITGQCELVSGEIGDDLTRYLYVSEQTPSSVGLGVSVAKDGHIEAAGGFFVQPLPEATEETISNLEKNVADIKSVSTMIKEGRGNTGIIENLLNGFPNVRILSTDNVTFKCQCSKRRIEDMLITLSEPDLTNLIADGKAEVNCHFCGEKYEFTLPELQAILAVKRRLREMKR